MLKLFTAIFVSSLTFSAFSTEVYKCSDSTLYANKVSPTRYNFDVSYPDGSGSGGFYMDFETSSSLKGKIYDTEYAGVLIGTVSRTSDNKTLNLEIHGPDWDEKTTCTLIKK